MRTHETGHIERKGLSMIIERYLTELSAGQRAAVETLLAEQTPGCAHLAPNGAPAWSVEDVIDLEHVGLLEYDAQVGTRVTAKGAQLVADSVYDTAVAEDAARRASTGRHALPEGAESTLPGLGVVVVADLPRHELTEVIAPVAEPKWPTEEGELDLDPVFAAFDADLKNGFIESFPEAAEEHTAELQAIAVDGWFRRTVSWVRVNSTPVRAAFVAATGGAFFGSLVTWAVTR